MLTVGPTSRLASDSGSAIIPALCPSVKYLTELEELPA